MLKFHLTRILFAAALLGLLYYDYGHDVPFACYVILVLAYSLVLFAGSYFIRLNFFLKARNSCPENGGIAVTFDDGPHANTGKILEVLQKYDSPAAFFLIGKNIPGNEDLVRKMARSGHLLSNHSWSHSNWFDFFSVRKLVDDVTRTDDLIEKLTGVKNRLFRPPFGVTTPNIARMVKKKGYRVIGWNLRSLDTTIRDKDKLLNRIFTRMKPGSVILLHDTTPGIDQIVERLLLHAQERKMKVVRVDELVGLNESKL